VSSDSWYILGVNHRFVALDGLRGIAAGAVVLYHLGTATGLPWLAPRGYLAVDFFFVLSGFVIAHAYGERLRTACLSPMQFLRVRLRRLWPTAVVGTLIGVAVVLLTPAGLSVRTQHGFALAMALNLMMLPNVVPGLAMFPANPPHWSLWYEIVANYAYAVIAPWLGGLALVALVLIAAVRDSVVMAHVGSGGHADVSRVAVSFFVGVLVYRVWNRGHRPRLNALILVATLIVALAWPAMPPGRALIDAILTLCVFPLVVWTGASVCVTGRAQRLAIVSGRLSYPLYAVHYPFILCVLWLIR
jgi:peptidoglycan/LPS O-acetylase OafA/YrhL